MGESSALRGTQTLGAARGDCVRAREPCAVYATLKLHQPEAVGASTYHGTESLCLRRPPRAHARGRKIMSARGNGGSLETAFFTFLVFVILTFLMSFLFNYNWVTGTAAGE